VAGTAALLAVYVPACLWGRGGRGFFSPDTLQAKTQHEWVIPLVCIPVLRTPFSHHTPELVEYLVAQGYWSPRDADDPLWLFTFHWNVGWHGGYAYFYKWLFWRQKDWIAWTRDHPDIAAEFWPQVLEHLRARGDESLPQWWWRARDCTSLDDYHELRRVMDDRPGSDVR
jgi:hypothetical protein